MTYHLIIGDYAYSSWSLRGWLLFEKFGINRDTTLISFRDTSVAEQLAEFAPAKTVPTVITDDGAILGDSLAIAEELASRHPEAGLWPSDPKARATARAVTTEMHSGFGALREFCPMHLRVAYSGVDVPEDVLADLERLETVWAHAREASGATGDWLCGEYSAVDAFYAPVAARIATYGLPIGPVGAAYVQAHLNDPAFRRWRAMGLVRGADLPWYARDYTQRDWPGPEPLKAIPVDNGPSENDVCPFSGLEITHYLELDGRVFGFCNAFCRDKTVADPGAWAAFMALLNPKS